MSVSIVDYGVANVASVVNMFSRIGVKSKRASTPREVLAAERLLLPGVGSFDHGMSTLHDLGLADAVIERATDGIPVLGICLGMQLLGTSSAEGSIPGLGLIPGRCELMVADAQLGVRIPHMGWSEIVPVGADPVLAGLENSARFYFVHSYHFVCDDEQNVLATSEHGTQFTSMIRSGAILGAQFHPEKSHRYGMQLLRNFASTG